MGQFNQNPVSGLIRKAQDQLEKRAGTLTDNESVLQQDRFWLKSVTWTLIGTTCLLYTSPSPRDVEESRMPSSA